MEYFQNIIYWISDGLLIPVFIAVAFFLLKGVFLIVRFYSLYVCRLKLNKEINPYIESLKINDIKCDSKYLLATYINKVLVNKANDAVREKLIADFEVECQKDLDQSRTLSKLGPMLGLMGTLIPMGPALGGLAAGDIAEMSKHLQIAFNTTVMGLVIGSIGYLTLQFKQRWYAKDLNIIEFINNTITKD
jgi:biopolymer transport protein ExbB/TolQ